MALDFFFYNCSKEYVASISGQLLEEIASELSALPKCKMQAELNKEIFKCLALRGWAYDSLSTAMKAEMGHNDQWSQVSLHNNRELCRTTCNLEANWHCDFAKDFAGKLVQVEAQFGKSRIYVQRLLRFSNCISRTQAGLGHRDCYE